LQLYLKLPAMHYNPGPVRPAAQISMLYYLQHQPTGFFLGGLINLFDTRPFDEVGFERTANDGITAFVASTLRDAQPDGTPYRYMTRSPFSAPSVDRYRWEDERFFRAHVSREQLQSMLEDTQAPGTVEEYRLIEVAVLIEAFPRLTGDSSMGGSLRSFEVYRFHDGD
jgi:hypothetical protein